MWKGCNELVKGNADSFSEVLFSGVIKKWGQGKFFICGDGCLMEVTRVRLIRIQYNGRNF